MLWTQSPPTLPGWYWRRNEWDTEVIRIEYDYQERMVYYDADDKRNRAVECYAEIWRPSEPIPLPEGDVP